MPNFIRPNRAEVSRSFPVLGFSIQTSTTPAWFEVALATDAALFARDAAAHRNASNFWSSHAIGAQVAERGDAIFLVPSDVLARFAGCKRLFYAMATFTTPAGGTPELTLPVASIAPYVAISDSYTGSSRRLRTSPSLPRPFTPEAESFAWAGDAAQPGVTEKVPVGVGAATPGPAAAVPAGGVVGTNGNGHGSIAVATPPHTQTAQSLAYDDGFGSAFWEEAYAQEDDDQPAAPSTDVDPEQYGIDGPPPESASDAQSPLPSAAQGIATSLDYSGVRRFVAAHPTNVKVGRTAGTTIDRIVIHITDARTTSSTVNWFTTQHPPKKESSAHYLVGQDGEVVQFVHEDDTAFHTRGANTRSIGIEHVATRGFNPTETEYCASATLVRDIAGRYNIPLDRAHIVGHNEITQNHPGCPTDAWDWDHYMQLVTSGSCEMGDYPLPSGDTAVAALNSGWALGDEPQNWASSYPTGPVPIGSYGDTWALTQGPDGSGLELRVGGTIAWRYNNPGNIRPGRMPYARAVNVGEPSGFAIFPSYAEGRHALADLLRSRRYGPLTLTTMFYTYLGMKPGVPSDQGDPEAYARGVIARTGLDGSRTVDSLDDSELGRLMDAIEATEGSRAGATYHPGDANIPSQFAPMLSGSAAAAPSSRDGGPPADASATPAAPDASAPADASAGQADTTAQMLGTSFDFYWPDVELVPQPTSMSCWAASAAMVVGWRDTVSIDPNEIVRGAGHWISYANISRGLNPDNRDELALAWQLETIPPQSYSVDGFCRLLESRGPLWVGVAIPSGHAICVYGIYGDGTPDGTYVRINDPWPPGRGEQRVQKFSEFETEYENRVTTDSQGNVNIQVLAAPTTNGRRPTNGTTAQALDADPAPAPAQPVAAPLPVTPASPTLGAAEPLQITTTSGTTGDITWSVDRADGVLAPWGDLSQFGSSDAFKSRTLTVHGPEVAPGSAGAPGDFLVNWRTNGRSVADVVIAPVPAPASGAELLSVRAEIQPRPEAVVPVAGDDPAAAIIVRFTFSGDRGRERGETSLALFGTGDVRTEAEWRRG